MELQLARSHREPLSIVGKPVDIGGVPCLETREGELGFVIYGPYETYGAGRYVATFQLALPEGNIPRDDTACCTIDVAANGARAILATARLYPSFLGPEFQSFDLSFEIRQPTVLEFRVRASGHAPFRVVCERVVRPVGPDVGRFSPVLAADVTVAPNFFTRHQGRFLDFLDKGVRFEIEDDRVIALWHGLRLPIEQDQDFQLLTEIFVRRDYGVVSGAGVCAIDIGMNIGFTSLFLAAQPFVEEVHGYEPFPEPFGRARANVALNPRFNGKITINNFGLADFDGERTVGAPPSESLGVSIRGTDQGDAVTIQIRDAAAVLGPLIERAVRRGLDVFAKIDCEGSEFAIIESLREAGLLSQITAMAVEWHKWWDYRKTQDDLFASLLPEGFIVFDLTQASNPDAGFFYAMRGSRSNASRGGGILAAWPRSKPAALRRT